MRSVEDRVVKGLQEFADVLKSGASISEQFTCKKVVLDLRPTSYGPKEVKATRSLLEASQAVFAQFLGVSPKTVRAWESGVNSPQDLACRFMDEIQRNPDYWRKRLRESVKVKQSH